MKILIGDKGNIDFESPVNMDKDQKEKFIEFLESMFEVVKVQETDSFRDERIGDKFFMKAWALEEYQALLNIENTTDKVAEILGRSWMSVDIKRGGFIPDFLAWTSENKKDPLKDDIKKLIKEFMKEKEGEILARRQQKSLKLQKQKELSRSEEELELLNSDKRKEELELFIRLGKISKEEAEKGVAEEKNALLKKIASLKKEVGES
ncbi:MAG: hypothetical protein ABH824_05675 [Nanoarchaeota archaeon]